MCDVRMVRGNMVTSLIKKFVFIYDVPSVNLSASDIIKLLDRFRLISAYRTYVDYVKLLKKYYTSLRKVLVRKTD